MEQVSHVFNFCYTDFYILYIVYMICTTKLQFVCFFIIPELLYLHFHMDILSVILSSSLQKPFPQDSWNHPWHSWEMYSYKKLNVQCRVLCNMFCVITSLKSQAPRFYVNITISAKSVISSNVEDVSFQHTMFVDLILSKELYQLFYYLPGIYCNNL